MWVPCQVRRHAQLQVKALLAMDHVHYRNRAKSLLSQRYSVHQVAGVLRLLKRMVHDEAHCHE